MKQAPGIHAEDVTVVWRNGLKAVTGATFTVPHGSIAALLGVNGSGKSTLFKAIMGFVRPSRGTISILGVPTERALKHNLLAYVPQAEEVDWTFPVLVKDVVMMGRYGHMGIFRIPKATDRKVVAEALNRVDMQNYSQRQIGELSGGQRKRVFLARAIAQQSQVILLDEPFTGVDIKSEEKIINLLCELRTEGKTILVSTHNLESVLKYCDHTVIIRGTVLASGPVETTFTPHNLEVAFGGSLHQSIFRNQTLGSGVQYQNDTSSELTVCEKGKKYE